MTRDERRDRLRMLGRRRAEAEEARSAAMDSIRVLVRMPDDGLAVAEIARLTGLTRQTIYTLRQR